MQQYNIEKNIEEKITDIIKNICELSEKVAGIIKEHKTNADNDIGDEIAISIEKIYEERSVLVNELKMMLENGSIDADLLKNNIQWNKYINEILPIEETNIEFLNTKTKEKKNKLNELFNNKSLMIYNKKVKLSYEDRVL